MKRVQEEGLVCRQSWAYRVTTKPRSGAEVAPNLLSQNFNPLGPDLVWVSDITYLKTGEGWSVSDSHYGSVLAADSGLACVQADELIAGLPGTDAGVQPAQFSAWSGCS